MTMPTHEIGDTVAVDFHTLNGRDPERRNGTVVAIAEDGHVLAEFPQGDLPPMTVAGPAEHFIAVRTTPERFERARQGRFLLWQHECGHVEMFPADWEPDDGGCDACESGSDRPADWQPLYVRQRTAPIGVTRPKAGSSRWGTGERGQPILQPGGHRRDPSEDTHALDDDEFDEPEARCRCATTRIPPCAFCEDSTDPAEPITAPTAQEHDHDGYCLNAGGVCSPEAQGWADAGPKAGAAREITPDESRQIGAAISDFMVAAGHPLTCNGGNPDWRSHHDHEVQMLISEQGLVCPECGRTQKLPASITAPKPETSGGAA